MYVHSALSWHSLIRILAATSNPNCSGCLRWECSEDCPNRQPSFWSCHVCLCGRYDGRKHQDNRIRRRGNKTWSGNWLFRFWYVCILFLHSAILISISGGSTIVVLFEKGAVEWDEDLLINGRASLETLVRVGMGIGRRGRRHPSRSPSGVRAVGGSSSPHPASWITWIISFLAFAWEFWTWMHEVIYNLLSYSLSVEFSFVIIKGQLLLLVCNHTLFYKVYRKKTSLQFYPTCFTYVCDFTIHLINPIYAPRWLARPIICIINDFIELAPGLLHFHFVPFCWHLVHVFVFPNFPQIRNHLHPMESLNPISLHSINERIIIIIFL